MGLSLSRALIGQRDRNKFCNVRLPAPGPSPDPILTFWTPVFERFIRDFLGSVCHLIFVKFSDIVSPAYRRRRLNTEVVADISTFVRV